MATNYGSLVHWKLSFLQLNNCVTIDLMVILFGKVIHVSVTKLKLLRFNAIDFQSFGRAKRKQNQITINYNKLV